MASTFYSYHSPVDYRECRLNRVSVFPAESRGSTHEKDEVCQDARPTDKSITPECVTRSDILPQLCALTWRHQSHGPRFVAHAEEAVIAVLASIWPH